MPQELFPTEVIKVMIPYADMGMAHTLEMMLQADQMHRMLEQTRESLRQFHDTWRERKGKDTIEYELVANEVGENAGRRTGQQMDVEGMIQAVQAVCGPEDRRRLNQMLMMLRMRRVMSMSQDPAKIMEVLSLFLSPEQKRQMEELLPLMSMMKEM